MKKRDDGLLTPRQVAEVLRVDPTTVRRWIKGGVLEGMILPHNGKRQVALVRPETMDRLLGNDQEGEKREADITIN